MSVAFRLFFAVELVKNRATKQAFNTMRDKVEGKPLVVDQQIAAKMIAQGVSIQSWVSHFVIAPPLIAAKSWIWASPLWTNTSR